MSLLMSHLGGKLPLDPAAGPLAWRQMTPKLIRESDQPPSARRLRSHTISRHPRHAMLKDSLTTVDDKSLADDVRRGVGAQPQDRSGDLFRACRATGRHIAEDLLPALRRAAREPLHHGRVDITWAYRVHADVLCCVVE